MNTQSHWARIVRAFEKKNIGIYGDFMLDELLQGEASRISPEAPVPVVLVNREGCAEGFPGGAGNVAANVAALGGVPIPWGAIGKDESGKRLARLLDQRGINCETLVQEPGRLTPHKLRIAAHHHQLLRLDVERVSPLSSESSEKLCRSFRRRAPKLDALIVSDYQKGSVRPEVCSRMFEEARRRRMPIFVDPKPAHADLCRGVTLATPNLHEAELMAGRAMRDARELESGCRELMERLECEHLLVTRGGEGMTLFTVGGRTLEITSEPRPVYDVTGAGDTVIAVVALAYASGASMLEAARLANLAAGRVVLRFGTSQISRAELIRAIRDSE